MKPALVITNVLPEEVLSPGIGKEQLSAQAQGADDTAHRIIAPKQTEEGPGLIIGHQTFEKSIEPQHGGARRFRPRSAQLTKPECF